MSLMNIQPRELEDGYVKRCFKECFNTLKSSSGVIMLIIAALVLVSVTSKALYVDTGLLGPSVALVFMAAMCFQIDSKQSAYSVLSSKSLVHYTKLMWRIDTVRIFAYICIFINVLTLCLVLSASPEPADKTNVELGKIASYVIAMFVILIIIVFSYIGLIFTTNLLFLLFIVMHTKTDEIIIKHKINFQSVPELISITKQAIEFSTNAKAFGYINAICLGLNVVYHIFSAYLGLSHAIDVSVMYTLFVSNILFQYYVIKEIIVGKPKEVTEESFSRDLQCAEL